jgi:hypothetical protein
MNLISTTIPKAPAANKAVKLNGMNKRSNNPLASAFFNSGGEAVLLVHLLALRALTANKICPMRPVQLRHSRRRAFKAIPKACFVLRRHKSGLKEARHHLEDLEDAGFSRRKDVVGPT